MATISLSFTLKNKVFSLCAAVKGTTKRNYKEVKGLVNPNFDRWDKKSQRFKEWSKEDVYNNRVLEDLIESYKLLIKDHNPGSGVDLFNMQVNTVYSSDNKLFDEFTLKEYVESLILEMKHDSTKVPSKNYQLYITLLYKLEAEGTVLNVPLNEITDTHFETFGKFILLRLKGVNYIPLMKRFKATINKALKNGLTKNVLFYHYIDHAPVTKADFDEVSGRVSVLSEKEYHKFETMDLSIVYMGGPKRDTYRELYRDFCMFIYEMKIRPCDAIRVKYTDIYNGDVLSMPNKKKMNYIDKRLSFQTVRLTPKAKSIIRKYKGQSTAGYIFPFGMNNYEWDLYNATSFNKWNNRKQATLQNVNEFLAKVKKILKVKQLTLYTFRHSAFTHEIKANKKSLMQIAKEGGTSVSMLEKHYFNHMC